MIRKMTADLCVRLTNDDWRTYIYSREPLNGKLDDTQRALFYTEAQNCGIELAKSVRAKIDGAESIREYAEHEGAVVQIETMPSASGYLMFASFTEPDKIEVYSEIAEKTDELIKENDLYEYTGNVPTQELLLAHELFHYLEFKDPGIYTMQKHITLWKVFNFSHRSRVIRLTEIGAEAFARELSGCKCSLNVYDVLMMYALNPQKGMNLYKKMMRICKGEVL